VEPVLPTHHRSQARIKLGCGGGCLTMAGSQQPSDSGDEALLQRLASGDQLAMRTLFARHQTRLFRFALRLLRDESVAEDVVHDVFLDLWRQAAVFSGHSQVSTWLMAVTRNKAWSLLRKRRELALEDGVAEAQEDKADDPETSLQKLDKAAAMRACLDRLSLEHREVIDLVYYHDASIEDVATIAGIPVNTVKTRLFHARKKLGEALKAAGIDRGWP
jgi:RNA polymerase sigma-70 factor, ECF subfamily